MRVTEYIVFTPETIQERAFLYANCDHFMVTLEGSYMISKEMWLCQPEALRQTIEGFRK